MRVQLLTKATESALLAAAIKNAGNSNGSSPVVVKFFTPDAQATWFVLEGERDGGDWRLFGLMDLGMGMPELGYVMLSELQAIRGRFGLPVERDRFYVGDLAKAAKSVGYELFDEQVAA